MPSGAPSRSDASHLLADTIRPAANLHRVCARGRYTPRVKRLTTLLSPDPARAARRVALAAIAAIAVLATPAVLGQIDEARNLMGDEAASLAWVAFSTAALSLLLARWVLSARTAGSAIGWIVGGGALAGALNAGLCLAGVIALSGTGSAPAALLVGCFVGGIVGLPLGAAYGATYALLVVPAVTSRLHPHHEAGDRLLYRAGGLLLAASVLGPLWPAPQLGTAVGAGAALVGAASTCVAAWRMGARRRLLAAIDAGAIVGLRSDSARGGADEEPLLPFWQIHGAPSDRVLVAPGELTPYRSERGARKLALTPSSVRTRRVWPANVRLVAGLVAAALAAGGIALTATMSSAHPIVTPGPGDWF